ncbi:MAG: hypothetical protein EOP48_21700, partial [Sphingobacteriales bacterium]
MNKQVITYSFLSHIYNEGTISDNLEDIFIPIVKTGLAKMCASGIRKGKRLEEIKFFVDNDSGLDMPTPFLRKMLKNISQEVNTQEHQRFVLFGDDSFSINEYVFDEYHEEQVKREKEILSLEDIFQEFLKDEGITEYHSSLYQFIERGKYSLGKYINTKYQNDTEDKTLEARFVNFIRSVPQLYRVLQSVYIGSILSTYLEFQPQETTKKVELVLDTNFVISLLDLNTPESTTNCQKLLTLGEALGYSNSVLQITLKEIDNLLKAKIQNFTSSFLSGLVDPEDIY